MPNLVPHPPRLLRTGLRAVIALLLAAAPGKAQVSSDVIPQVDSTGPVWRTGAVGLSGEIRADVMPELDGDAITRDRDYLQTSLEIGAVMAVGLGVYIYKGERNRYDWALTWDRVRERFTTTDHFRFDDNEFAMNNVAHPVAGALYYRFARANGFGPLGSALFSAGGSTFWEVVVELREVASLNDLVATPATGIALGEALHQHQDFFRRGAPTLRNAVLEKLLAGPFLVQRLYGDDPPVPADRLDRYGFPADRAHRFRVYGGPLVAFEDLTPSPAPESPWLATLGLSSEITSVEPTDEGGLHETGGLPLTRLDLQLSFSEVRPTEMHLAAETVLGGWRGGAIHRTGAGLRGFRWIVGPSTGFTMRLDHAPDTRFMDMQAVAHMLGLRTDWVVRRGRLRARWHGAAFADFSSVRPLGIER
ncbi:MAG: DUF3943 domain-containing protein, partial [Gemmatimonadetes bacterium]|nr:DUF3943 domain-containing protein [Gemmatimonadota bacterium]NIQ56289.1 DUF3943 domain-containing protein [Gemmatimonadota bacterium]NIU74056.1 DUF3943 domain-containing protein [Gammaproteobacteria bacterium]NIX45960.1 DUF3943 domain-containing protein [Gemmatimonadota bacterium]NIY10275.1 DUF3943 domain-containing protein [Gemmatimonadota bacterium]